MNKFAIFLVAAALIAGATAQTSVSSRIHFNTMTAGTAVGQENHYDTVPNDADIVLAHSTLSGDEQFTVVNHAFCTQDGFNQCLYHEASGGSGPVGEGTLSFIASPAANGFFPSGSALVFRYACLSTTTVTVTTYTDDACTAGDDAQATLTCDSTVQAYDSVISNGSPVECIQFHMESTNFATGLYIDGMGAGDTPTNYEPHFYSFSDREQYLVTGESAEVYNIISSPTESVNYRFVSYDDHPTWANGVWIEEAGIVACVDGVAENCHKESAVRVAIDAENNVFAEVDGVRAVLGQTNLDNKGRHYVEVKESSVTVQTFKFMMTFTSAGEAEFPFMNVILAPIEGKVNDYAHGLLGQTGAGPVNEDAPAHTTEKWVEGDVEQYHMDSLFATEYTFSRYH